jgi:hypothetical protein
MRRSNEHIHGSRRLHRALGLGLSGAALVGLIYFEGVSARAEAGAEDEEASELESDAALELDEADEAEEADVAVENAVLGAGTSALPPSGRTVEPAPSPATPADGRLAMATVAEVDTASAMPVAPPVPVLVAVPDIEGMSLRKARKELKALGLKLAARDEYGEKVPREYWSGYKVRKQKLEAGTEVAPGSTVKVKARMRADYLMGY